MSDGCCPKCGATLFEAELLKLEAVAKKMRELGMTEYGNIKLGPLPVKEDMAVKEEREAERALREQVRRRDVMFAASHIKPKLRSA